MMLPVMTVIVTIFILWINYEIFKSSKHNKDEIEQFWNREKGANASSRKSILSLDVIIISAELLPKSDTFDDTANSYRDIILSMSGKKAVNLSKYTNTELKLQYGVANLKLLTEFDNNYTKLVSMLWKWALRLHSLGLYMEAEAVLEYAVICKTDVSGTYLLLSELYQKRGKYEKIESLIPAVRESEIHNKEILVKKLLAIMNS